MKQPNCEPSRRLSDSSKNWQLRRTPPLQALTCSLPDAYEGSPYFLVIQEATPSSHSPLPCRKCPPNSSQRTLTSIATDCLLPCLSLHQAPDALVEE